MARQVPGEPYARITSQEAYEMVQSGDSTVVDVRNPDEWEAGHVEGALWVPVDDIIPRFDELPGQTATCSSYAKSELEADSPPSTRPPWAPTLHGSTTSKTVPRLGSPRVYRTPPARDSQVDNRQHA